MVDVHNNTELSWEDRLMIKLKELDEAQRQSSDQSINMLVQNYLQQVRDKNREIVKLTQEKEAVESKMLQAVDEADLSQLQGEHQDLIREHESLIKQKLDIFTKMTRNLKEAFEGNQDAISNEEKLAVKKLAIEIWDRDIYQKKRVNIDVQVEIQNILAEIEQDDRHLTEREQRIRDLEKELEDAEIEYKEFKNDSLTADQKITELRHRLENSEEERAKLLAEEEERRRQAELEAQMRPEPVKHVKKCSKYTASKGDAVDEKMALYINEFELDVPIQRIGDGQYMFGSRKIFAKILNDKLVIRVGGGYMLIDEFLATYGQQELDKITQGAKRGQIVQNMGSPTRRGSPGANTMFKGTAGRMSPTANRASPTAYRGSPTAGKQIGFK